MREYIGYIDLGINLFENLQLANRLYFNTGEIDDRGKKLILSITGGDIYTKVISDLYLQLNEYTFLIIDNIKNDLISYYNQLKSYNKNFLPIKDYDVLNRNGVITIFLLKNRGKIIDVLKDLPSIAKRNLRGDFRKSRDDAEFANYENLVSYFKMGLASIDNRNEEDKVRIYKKMFKSGSTINSVLDFMDEKSNLMDNKTLNKNAILEMCEDENLKLIYDENNVMVIAVYSHNGIMKLGCNSFWCFTYGVESEAKWYNYSHYGMVYVIVNLDESPDVPEFMHVIIKELDDYIKAYEINKNNGDISSQKSYTLFPVQTKMNIDKDYESYDSLVEDDPPIFNMTNEPIYDPIGYLYSLIGEETTKKLITFQ